MNALSRWLLAPTDAFLYGLLRLFFGLSGFCKFTGITSPVPRLVQGGFQLGLPLHRYGESNFAPGVLSYDGFPSPTYAQYCAVESVAVVVAVFVAAGVFSRVSTFVFAACCWFLLLVDPAGFKHNLFALACFGLLIAASPCGDRCSVDAVVRRRLSLRPPPPRTAFWLRLVQTQVVVIYVFSVAVKLSDGWSTGHLLFHGVPKSVERLHARGLDWLVPFVEFRPLYAVASWITVAVEAFLIVGFAVPRLRWWALFVGVWLHTAIDLGVDVGSYSLTMFAIYLCFIDPRPAQTKVRAAPRTARWLRACDWLRRLDVVVDPDVVGFVVDGGSAKDVWWRLPLTFPFAFAVDQGRAVWERLRRR